jgi:hypothetical protein
MTPKIGQVSSAKKPPETLTSEEWRAVMQRLIDAPLRDAGRISRFDGRDVARIRKMLRSP